MKNYLSVITFSLLLTTLVTSAIADSATTIEIGQTSSTITDGGGCDFWRAKSKDPKLVKNYFDGGRYAHVVYEHESGGPILLEGQDESDKTYKRIAALNINGKELLLDMTKAESIQCSDETHNKKVSCESREYADQTIRVNVKPLSNQSTCFPHTDECARNSVSALVTVESSTSKVSTVVVGSCGG